MYEHTTYIAYDGTEFNSKQECINYEEQKNLAFEFFQKNVHVFSDKGEPIHFSNENDFILNYDKMIYLEIDNDLSEEQVRFIEESGYDPIPLKKGVYWYSTEAYKYISYDEMWGPFREILKKWL